MGIFNYSVISMVTNDEFNSRVGVTKDQVIEHIENRFNLVRDRSVYSCEEFAVRVCTSKTHSFSNTVLSLSALQKYDSKPFIVILVTPDGCEYFLANTTFLKKISHSSRELRIDNIKGSFNGSDIMREYDGVTNTPENFERLFAIHQAFTWEENLERLVEATNNISPSKTRYDVDAMDRRNILDAPRRAKEFQESDSFIDLRDDLNGRTARVQEAICIAALIDNVNLRGRVIEELVTTDDPQIIRAIVKSLKDGEGLSLKTDQKLGDYSKVYAGFHTETDIKTKVLFLQSAPKAYNVDKLLEFLATDDSVYLFFLIGVDRDNSIKTHLVSAFQTDLLKSTRVQHHWAGRNSRGVTQLEGSVLDTIIENQLEDIDMQTAESFLDSLIQL